MEHMKIDNMRDNSAINNRPPKADKNWKSPYVRKGGTGGWKNYFTNESTLKKFDEWIEKNNIDSCKLLLILVFFDFCSFEIMFSGKLLSMFCSFNLKS